MNPKEKKKRSWKSTLIICGIGVAVLLVSNFFMTRLFSINEKNPTAFKEQVYNYEKFPEGIDLTTATSQKPQNVSSYIVVRQSPKDETWSIIHSSISWSKEWTQEDLNNFEYIVFAVSGWESETYRRAGGTNTVQIRSEYIDLYYYDIRTRTVTSLQQLPARELPDKKSDSYDYKYSDNTITAEVKKYLSDE